MKSENWIKAGTSSDKFLREISSALDISITDYLTSTLDLFERTVSHVMNEIDGKSVKDIKDPEKFRSVLERSKLVDDDYNVVVVHAQVVDLGFSENNFTFPTLASLSCRDENKSWFAPIDFRKFEGSLNPLKLKEMGFHLRPDPTGGFDMFWSDEPCLSEKTALQSFLQILKDSSSRNILVFPRSDSSLGTLLLALSRCSLLQEFRSTVIGIGTLEFLSDISTLDLPAPGLEGFDEYYENVMLQASSSSLNLKSKLNPSNAAGRLYDIFKYILRSPPSFQNFVKDYAVPLHSSLVDLALVESGLLELRLEYHEMLINTELDLEPGAIEEVGILIKDYLPSIDKAYNILCYGTLKIEERRVLVNKDNMGTVCLTNTHSKPVKLSPGTRIGLATKLPDFPLRSQPSSSSSLQTNKNLLRKSRGLSESDYRSYSLSPEYNIDYLSVLPSPSSPSPVLKPTPQRTLTAIQTKPFSPATILPSKPRKLPGSFKDIGERNKDMFLAHSNINSVTPSSVTGFTPLSRSLNSSPYPQSPLRRDIFTPDKIQPLKPKSIQTSILDSLPILSGLASQAQPNPSPVTGITPLNLGLETSGIRPALKISSGKKTTKFRDFIERRKNEKITELSKSRSLSLEKDESLAIESNPDHPQSLSLVENVSSNKESEMTFNPGHSHSLSLEDNESEIVYSTAAGDDVINVENILNEHCSDHNDIVNDEDEVQVKEELEDVKFIHEEIRFRPDSTLSGTDVTLSKVDNLASLPIEVQGNGRSIQVDVSDLKEFLEFKKLKEQMSKEEAIRLCSIEKTSVFNQTVKPVLSHEPENPSFSPEPECPSFSPEPENPLLSPEPENPPFSPEPENSPFSPEPENPPFSPEPENPLLSPEPENPSFSLEPENPLLSPEPGKLLFSPEHQKLMISPEPEKSSKYQEPVKSSNYQEPAKSSKNQEPEKSFRSQEPEKTSISSEPKNSSTSQDSLFPVVTSDPEKPSKSPEPMISQPEQDSEPETSSNEREHFSIELVVDSDEQDSSFDNEDDHDNDHIRDNIRADERFDHQGSSESECESPEKIKEEISESKFNQCQVMSDESPCDNEVLLTPTAGTDKMKDTPDDDDIDEEKEIDGYDAEELIKLGYNIQIPQPEDSDSDSDTSNSENSIPALIIQPPSAKQRSSPVKHRTLPPKQRSSIQQRPVLPMQKGKRRQQFSSKPNSTEKNILDEPTSTRKPSNSNISRGLKSINCRRRKKAFAFNPEHNLNLNCYVKLTKANAEAELRALSKRRKGPIKEMFILSKENFLQPLSDSSASSSPVPGAPETISLQPQPSSPEVFPRDQLPEIRPLDPEPYPGIDPSRSLVAQLRRRRRLPVTSLDDLTLEDEFVAISCHPQFEELVKSFIILEQRRLEDIAEKKKNCINHLLMELNTEGIVSLGRLGVSVSQIGRRIPGGNLAEWREELEEYIVGLADAPDLELDFDINLAVIVIVFHFLPRLPPS